MKFINSHMISSRTIRISSSVLVCYFFFASNPSCSVSWIGFSAILSLLILKYYRLTQFSTKFVFKNNCFSLLYFHDFFFVFHIFCTCLVKFVKSAACCNITNKTTALATRTTMNNNQRDIISDEEVFYMRWLFIAQGNFIVYLLLLLLLSIAFVAAVDFKLLVHCCCSCFCSCCFCCWYHYTIVAL